MVASMTLHSRPSSPRAPRAHGRTSISGFTLVELAVVVAIVAVAATVAAPSFSVFIDTMHAKSAALDLVSDLATARSEALKRNAAVTMEPLGADWSSGWQIKDVDGGELRRRSALRTGLSVSAPVPVVSFLPNGRLDGTDINSGNAAWAIDSTVPGVASRCVVITPSGTARAKQGSCT
jgi:type IV fimbrial biogenesis protein FimT